MTITLDVYGIPQPQGSHKAVMAGGFARVVPSGGGPFAAWRNAVAERANAAAAAVDGPLVGPLRLTVVFRYPMPPSTIRKADRAAGWRWKTTTHDLDKLVRCIGDGLAAGGLIADDRLFVDIHACKIEVLDGWHGASITIEPLDHVRWTMPLDVAQQALL
jgi:Holliday junction resolvase RusA-like endonuclease